MYSTGYLDHKLQNTIYTFRFSSVFQDRILEFKSVERDVLKVSVRCQQNSEI
jgi:hypothetical protein